MLVAQNLAAQRGDALLFEGLDFALRPGAALFVSGPNGSGKTTLLRIAAALTHALRGKLTWDGTPVEPFAPAMRAAVLFIGHASALKEELSAEENLASLVALHGTTAEAGALAEALAAWSLARQRALPARVLSQGQRRRIGLARLQLVSRPLWVLDEPLTALDAAGVDTLRDALGEHLARGGMALIATHQAFEPRAGTVHSLRLQ
ncbi:MAG TPA: cytochrome c biogenesis heme-transporting ATPase CcmA [Casimicrobiaceae bacterium]|nr:cytochrome c biogenesis heme-transporting ATPase CcmA [Casimicrobiaceae bacterium]